MVPKIRALREVAAVRSGFMFKSADWRESGVPVVKIGNVKPGFISLDGCSYVGESTAEAARNFELEPSDIVIAMTGYVGEVARVGPVGRALLNQRVGRFQITDPTALTQDYLFYYLRQESVKAEFVSLAHGSAQANLSSAAILSIEISLPSISEQTAIAEVLSALDDKIAINIRASNTAAKLAGDKFDHAVSSLPNISMSEVLTPILGGTPPRANEEFWDGKELWASAKDITGAPFSVVTTTEEKITQQAVERTKAKPLPAGSVVLTARGTVGAVARLAVPASFNQSCYGFIPDLDGITPSILYFSILRAADQAKSLAHGSVFDTITMRTFNYLQIPDFGGSAVHIEAQLAPLLNLVTANVQENKALATTRDTLLSQLMSGKLRVKDAETLVEAVA